MRNKGEVKMKKILITIMIICLAITGVACGGNDTPTDEDAPIIFKTAHVDSEDGPIHQSYVKFKEYVEEKSDGKIVVEIYPNAELGGERQVVEAIALGTIQMSAVSPSSLTLYDDKFSVLSLPFLFDTKEQMEEAISGDFGNLCAK